MAWINKNEIIAALVRVALVGTVVKAGFGRYAENYEVVQSVESYKLGLRDLRSGQIVIEREYSPNDDIDVAELFKGVLLLRDSLGIPKD